MKTLFTTLLLTFSVGASYAGTNLSDTIDKNEVPAELEKRENEVINKPDVVDKNGVPSVLEERQKEEEWREDYDKEQFDTKKFQNKKRD